MTMTTPKIRRIYQSPPECDRHANTDDAKLSKDQALSCAYHITNAFDLNDLEKLDQLRTKIPLDLSRPTCPRRFLTEKKPDAATGSSCQQHQEDGWVGALIDATVASSWNLPFCSLPWYRYLEYTEPGGHSMAKHSDGSNVHPRTGARSVATMLLYLSTCQCGGGATTLYRRKKKKKGAAQHQTKKPTTSTNSSGSCGSSGSSGSGSKDMILESIRPVYNSVLIFPHAWEHSGDPVVQDPKIALRVDLAWKTD